MKLLEYSGDHTGRHFDFFSINRGSKYRFPFVFILDYIKYRFNPSVVYESIHHFEKILIPNNCHCVLIIALEKLIAEEEFFKL
jgi:hypothetical protein